MPQQSLLDFQEFLLKVLYESDDPQQIMTQLEAYKHHPIWGQWLAQFDPGMIEVAARMTQHWCLLVE